MTVGAQVRPFERIDRNSIWLEKLLDDHIFTELAGRSPGRAAFWGVRELARIYIKPLRLKRPANKDGRLSGSIVRSQQHTIDCEFGRLW